MTEIRTSYESLSVASRSRDLGRVESDRHLANWLNVATDVMIYGSGFCGEVGWEVTGPGAAKERETFLLLLSYFLLYRVHKNRPLTAFGTSALVTMARIPRAFLVALSFWIPWLVYEPVVRTGYEALSILLHLCSFRSRIGKPPRRRRSCCVCTVLGVYNYVR
jgi:hypothetical protein